MFRPYLFFLLIMVLTGCVQDQVMTKKYDYVEPDEQPQTLKPVETLCLQHGMAIENKTKDVLKLSNSKNRVFLFAGLDKAMYVNGEKLPERGGFILQKDNAFISDQTLVAISSALAPIEERVKPLKNGKRIVIDPGHGGRDPGAVSVLGYYEKDINLEVALHLSQILRNKGFEVILTRSSDTYLSLESRVWIGNKNRPDLFLSLHTDSSENAEARGYTVYISKSASMTSKYFARAIHQSLSGTGFKKRGVRETDFFVLQKTNCPAVLVEMGFLSNRSEAAILSNPAFRKKLGEYIARGVVDNYSSL